VGDDLKEGITGRWGTFPVQPDVDGEGLRTLEVDAGFVRAFAIEVCP